MTIPVNEFMLAPSSVLRLLKTKLSDSKIKTYEHRLYCTIDAILLYREGIVSKRMINRWEYC